MVERFTEGARRAMVLATDEARSRRHEAIGPEHLLMGILREGACLDLKVLERIRVSPETLQAEVERALSVMAGSPPAASRSSLPSSNRSWRRLSSFGSGATA